MAEPSTTRDRDEAVRFFEEGAACLNTGNTKAARQHFEAALRHDPSLAEARHNLALLCARDGDHHSAIALLQECCRQRPSMAAAHNALGGLLLRIGNPSAALTFLEQANRLAPGDPVAPNNLGLCLLALQRPAEAEAAFRQALAIAPANPDIASNLGSSLHAQERNQDAVEVFENILTAQPSHDRARLNLALALLSDARYPEAWPHFEARRQLGLSGAGRRFPGIPWNGHDPIEGRTVLVHAEQGLGDSLQFARFLPRLLAQGARLHLELQAPLLPLFRTLPGLEGLHVVGQILPICDYHCALPSLPGLLGMDQTALLPANPGLTPDPELSRFWSAQVPLKDSRPRIGLVWAGSPGHANDHARSLRAQTLAESLRGQPFSFIPLQHEATHTDLQALADTLPTLLPAPALRSFADSAAVLENIDLLVSVDTAWAHLGGLLGKPTWLLLPRPCDWRWSPALPSPGWYPSLRLFRQQRPGDWTAPLAELCQALGQFPRQG